MSANTLSADALARVNERTADMHGGLAARTTAGGAWIFATRSVQQSVVLAQTLVLARLLSPRDFGLMGIALLAMRFVETFTHTGYEVVVIQRERLSDEDLHTIWWVLLARRVLLGAALLLLAEPLASFFHEPDAALLLRALSVVQIITGLSSLSPILFHRELDFRNYFWSYVPSSLAMLVVSVIAALWWRNVWALFAGVLALSLVGTVVSYALHPYRPCFQFNGQTALELSRFGRWLLGATVLFYLVSQGADMVSGWWFGAAALGIYQVAGRFAQPSYQLGETVLNAVLPTYALMQREPARLAQAFVRVLSVSLFVVLPLTVLLAIGAPWFIAEMLGTQWLALAPLLTILVLVGCVRIITRTGSPLFMATGHPQWQFTMDVIAAVVMVALFYPLGAQFGLLGLAWASLVGALCVLPAWWWGVRRILGCAQRELFSAMVPSVVAALGMACLLYLGAPLVLSMQEALRKILIASALAFAAMLIYLLVCSLVARWLVARNPLSELSALLHLHRTLARLRAWRRE